jgi:hypothetical protein
MGAPLTLRLKVLKLDAMRIDILKQLIKLSLKRRKISLRCLSPPASA